MRVVMVGPFGLRPKATMSVRALRMAKALVRRGHLVTVLLPPWDCPEDSGKRWSEDGVWVENVTLPPRVPLFWHASIVGRLVRRVLAMRPDVVHCFKPKAYAGLTAWALWQLRRLRLFGACLVVDSDDWEGPGGWNDREPYSRPQKWLFAWQERWGLRHSDALTLASRALETIVWSMGIPPGRTVYVPNGVEERQVPRSGLPVAGGSEPAASNPSTVLLYTRFFEFQLDRVVEAFRLIRRARPDVRFLVVGKGLFGEEGRFLALCQAAGLAEAVEYAGWVAAEALPAHFAEAAVAVYPFDDTLINRTKCSVKLLDLLAAGVPVVAEAVGQNAVAIEHGVSGLLVPSGDPAALAEAVVQVLADPSWRERLGQNARRRMREDLTWERLAEQVEMAYHAGG